MEKSKRLTMEKLKPKPQDYIPTDYVIGKKYTTSWAAKKTMTWTLVSVFGSKCVLSKNNGESFVANLIDLRETEENAIKKIKKRLFIT